MVSSLCAASFVLEIVRHMSIVWNIFLSLLSMTLFLFVTVDFLVGLQRFPWLFIAEVSTAGMQDHPALRVFFLRFSPLLTAFSSS